MILTELVLIEKIKLAQLANEGDVWQSKYCECDASVGMVPCQYCAIYDALKSTSEYLQNIINNK